MIYYERTFFFILQFGVFPIEVAALQVHREIVEMLFPLTSPISTVLDWSIDGIFAHAKNFGSKPLVSFFFPSLYFHNVILQLYYSRSFIL